jgi:hypothetical protein
MKHILLLAVALLANVVSVEAKNPPSLVGGWTSTYTVSYPSGATRSAGTLYVTKQSGPDFSGYLTWKNLDTGKSGKEKFAGSFDYNDKDFVIAQEDGGTMKGQLDGANKMKVLLWQSASARGVTLTFRATFVRAK